MGKKGKYHSTESMKEFGRYLKLLRCPEYHAYRSRIVEDLTGSIYIGKYDQTTLDDVDAFFREFVAFEDLPQTFRDLQLASKRYGLEILPLREVAKTLKISKNTLHDYEQGKRYPPVEFIYDYCAEYALPIDSVLHNWVLYHPNENVRLHTEQRFEDFYTHPLSLSYTDKKRDSARQFFSIVMNHALSRSGVIGLSDRVKNKITHIFSEITDRTLAQGKELSPENVSLDMLNDIYEWLE